MHRHIHRAGGGVWRAMTIYASSTRRSPKVAPTGLSSVQYRVGRWFRRLVIIFALLVIGMLLLVEAYTNASFAPDGTANSTQSGADVPVAVRDGGPVIDALNGPAQTLRPADHTIALTFDDGPDPTWTPRVLDVLERYQVPATFFLVGSHVARNPGLARRIVDQGDEVGVHTFSHPNLDAIPTWRRDLEYSQT